MIFPGKIVTWQSNVNSLSGFDVCRCTATDKCNLPWVRSRLFHLRLKLFQVHPARPRQSKVTCQVNEKWTYSQKQNSSFHAIQVPRSGSSKGQGLKWLKVAENMAVSYTMCQKICPGVGKAAHHISLRSSSSLFLHFLHLCLPIFPSRFVTFCNVRQWDVRLVMWCGVSLTRWDFEMVVMPCDAYVPLSLHLCLVFTCLTLAFLSNFLRVLLQGFY